MMMLLRIHVVFFAICLSVYPTRTRAISNIFNDFTLFDFGASNNDTAVDIVNVTIHQGILRLENICIQFHLL